jgi:hypothetical protein
MASTATIGTITITVTGDDGMWAMHIPQQTNAASPFTHQQLTLASGTNTLVVPTGATMLVILPPTTSVVTKTLKGLTADTGIPIPPAAQWILPIAAGVTSIVITAGGIETIDVWWL